MWDNLCGEISSTEDATKVALNHEENCQLAFGTSRGQCFPLEIWNMVELLELPLLLYEALDIASHDDSNVQSCLMLRFKPCS